MLEWSFLLKKVVAAFCMPLPIFFLLCGLSVFLYSQRKLLLAKAFCTFAILFLYLISIQITGDFLANQLENKYPSYKQSENIDYVLVLGSDHTSDASQPISSLLSSSGLKRLVEGIRVYRLNPGAKLLLSGYRFDDDISHAQALKNVALHFGVPSEDIILAEQVKDTQEEAAHWVAFAQGKSLALVTSASHMPRSMFLFNHAQKDNNLKVSLYPAPTDYMSNHHAPLTWRSWFPSGKYMMRVERAWHEYLGCLWANIIAKR